MSASTTTIVKLQLRRDTTTNWNSTLVPLSEGEFGFDITTGTLKIGGLGGSMWGSAITVIGASGGIPSGNSHGDYLFFDGLQWVVGSETVSIGSGAGETDQQVNAVAIGNNAGNDTQGTSSVAIGNQAGQVNQKNDGVAIGNQSGNDAQGISSIAIGNQAGQVNQKNNGVAIGNQAGRDTQGGFAIAIGNQAGNNNQGGSSIAIGNDAGQIRQGINCIAIGKEAGVSDQPDNSIAINASGTALNPSTTNSCYIRPIRSVTSLPSGFVPLYYNPLTYEVIALD